MNQYEKKKTPCLLVNSSTCRNYPFHGCKGTASATMLQYLKLGFCAKYLKVIIPNRSLGLVWILSFQNGQYRLGIIKKTKGGTKYLLRYFLNTQDPVKPGVTDVVCTTYTPDGSDDRLMPEESDDRRTAFWSILFPATEYIATLTLSAGTSPSAESHTVSSAYLIVRREGW